MSKRYFQQPVARPVSPHPAGPPSYTFWKHASQTPSNPDCKLPTNEEPLTETSSHSNNTRPFTASNGGPPRSEMAKRTHQPQALGLHTDQRDLGAADSLEIPKGSSSTQPDNKGFRFGPTGKIIVNSWRSGTVSQAVDFSNPPTSRDSIEYRSTDNTFDDHVPSLNRPTIEKNLEPPLTATTVRAARSPARDQLSWSLTQRNVPSHINPGPRRAPPIQALYGNLAMYDRTMSRQLQGAHSQCLRQELEMKKLRDQVNDRDQIICTKEAEVAHTGEQLKKLQDEKTAVEASLLSIVSISKKLHTDQEEFARTRQLQVTALQKELDLKQDELAAEKLARNQLRVTLDGIQKSVEAGKEAVSTLNHLRMDSQATTRELATVNSALVQARVEVKEKNALLQASQRSFIQASEKLRDIETTISTLLAAIATQLKFFETGVLKAPATILEVLDTIQSLQTSCSSLNDQLSHTKSELALERAHNSDLQGRFEPEQPETLISDLDGLDEDVGALQSSALHKLKTKLAEKDRDARSWEEALQKMSSDMEMRNIQLQSRAEEIKSLQALLEELKSEKVQLSADLTVAEGEKANLQKLLDSKEVESKKVQSTTGHQQELQRLRDQITGSDQREKVANSKLRDTTVELEDTRRQLKELSKTEMSDIRSPLERYQANELVSSS
ncbi:hypothetical protein BCR39DRAFT_105326 [Naematelia encephala]|uniref:Uncharacterized protein n=1 Tax=Naematelia encephala TaxID=71784 RepID=A0A1Y2B7X0_9TREE|nr:hypothetical protein BCR39DRAFT_105326 [Naematelia encephala]